MLVDLHIMTIQWYVGSLLATGYFTFGPLALANGVSGGHISAGAPTIIDSVMSIVATSALFGVHRLPTKPASTSQTIRTRRLRSSMLGRSNKLTPTFSQLKVATSTLLPIAIFQ
jgi:hypothetical protein